MAERDREQKVLKYMAGSEEKDLERLLRNIFVCQHVSHIVANPKKRGLFEKLWEAIDYARDRDLVVLDEEIPLKLKDSNLKDMVAYKLTVKGKEYFGLYSELN